MTGNVVIITSPSGGGKGTLIKEVLKNVPNIGYSVSLTTRPQRPGEVDGVDYNFVSRAAFEDFKARGEFLEFAEVHGNLYGTSLTVTEKLTAAGRDVILEIDVQGAAEVLAKMPDAISIFILPPSFEALAQRLTARATEGPAELALRLRNSFDEVNRYTEFKYVVVNDNLTAAVKRLQSIIVGQRQLRTRQTVSIRDILNSFDMAKKAYVQDSSKKYG